MLQLRLNHPLSKPNELIGNEKGKGESTDYQLVSQTIASFAIQRVY
jgi:hypothetical protein